jgi:hypothetical protein
MKRNNTALSPRKEVAGIDSEPRSFVEQIDWEPLVSSSTCNNLLLVNIVILFIFYCTFSFLKLF